MLMGVFLGPLRAQTAAPAKAESLKVVPICDLLRRLDKFAGKRVAVRGVYRFSMEVEGLYSEGCPKPLILDGAARAQALWTVFAVTSSEQTAHFMEATNGVKKGGERQAIHVTFIGALITRNPNLHRLGQRKGERMFGHLGVFPAQLNVDSIEDITIEDGAHRPSNMELQK